MHTLNTNEQVDELFTKALAIIFKHSNRCPISGAAKSQVELYLREHPGAPVYMVDVVADRPVSLYIEEKTKVQHQSPQILVVKGGRVTWHASHASVNASSIAKNAGL